MRVKLGIVSETNSKFINQVKLLIYSLRKNGGLYKDTPVVLITNDKPIQKKDREFLEKHFSPIEFKTMPRLGAIPHTSKLNVFHAIDPSTYDALLFMDCDTVIKAPLDSLFDPIEKGEAEFLCRRGGKSDRESFVDFDSLVKEFCGDNYQEKTSLRVNFGGEKEWPMFNTGVFVATPNVADKIKDDSIQITYKIFNEWRIRNIIESIPLFSFLYKKGILKSKKKVIPSWPIEQGAVALSCIKNGVKVQYLDEIYNSWGNLEDLKILHCFKSAYKFDRSKMFTSDSDAWIKEYEKSDTPGKVFLAEIMKEYKDKYC